MLWHNACSPTRTYDRSVWCIIHENYNMPTHTHTHTHHSYDRKLMKYLEELIRDIDRKIARNKVRQWSFMFGGLGMCVCARVCVCVRARLIVLLLSCCPPCMLSAATFSLTLCYSSVPTRRAHL